jgi:hypothetical protein
MKSGPTAGREKRTWLMQSPHDRAVSYSLRELDRDLVEVFGAKAHVYTARDLDITGTEDVRVIDAAIQKKCLIVTANKDFVDYYRNHPLRKGKVAFFYGLIFLKPSRLSRRRQLARALREIAWDETRNHDDLVTVYSNGSTAHERLCHPECAAAMKQEEDALRRRS